MKRDCEICHASVKKYIYTPRFYLVGRPQVFKFDVTLCRRCGFLFADNIPSQKRYDDFYRHNAKYLYNTKIPAGLRRMYQEIFSKGLRFLKSYKGGINKKIRILDIGCSIGYILSLFKRLGFSDLQGIEPSRYCRAVARKLYGVQVITSPLAAFKDRRKFELIVMTGVLEHVANLSATLKKVAALLVNDGLLMIETPDVDKFNRRPKIPFEQFSIEHINYFNQKSLINLASQYGLNRIYSANINAKFYDSDSTLLIFNKTGERRKITPDCSGYRSISHYILRSEKQLGFIGRRIDALAKDGVPVVVWGTGSLTSRLLTTTNLFKAKIRFFVDSSRCLQGKLIHGSKIVPPDIFKKLTADHKVLIASYIYGKEMKKALLKKYKFKGEVITL